MRAVKWTLGILVLLVVGVFLHYVMPKREVVYITQTTSRIVEPGELRGIRAFSGSDTTTTATTGGLVADVFFVDTVKRDGGVLVFRNEDTGFGFPPYLKFDSANVQAQAQDAVSTRDSPNWVIARYYGWRIPFLSMFPNLTSMKPAPNPDALLIPWLTIVVALVLLAVVWAIWTRLRRWSQRRADPAVAAWETPGTKRGWFGR